MNIKRLSLILLLASTLSCNTIMQALQDSTAEPLPTSDLEFETPIAPFDTETPPDIATPEPNLPTDGSVYIPPDCQGEALATVPPATMVAEPTPVILETNPPIDSETQLSVFNNLVAKIDEVYLYPDYNGVDWPSIVDKYRAKVESGLDTETFYTEMGLFVTELKDEHSHFESPAQVAASEAELSGRNDYVGIGALVLPLPEKGRVTILSIFPNSAAAHGGLKQHDSILAVDGVPIVSDGEAHPLYTRGPQCSAVVLTIESPGEAPRDVTLVRFRITEPVPIDAQLVTTTDGSRIGYIFIPTFFDQTIPDQIQKALEDFGQLDGLILDNRVNSGGSSSVVEPILSFLTSGLIGHFVSRADTRPLDIQANEINNSQSVPLVVLVGEDTISFGEIFSGALQDIGRAKIAGKTTLGNVETLHGYDFEDGSRVWIAEERFDPLNSHADWEKNGIIPDSEAFADWDTFTFDNDPSVAAAVTLLGHQ